jgi:hypothetical protein
MARGVWAKSIIDTSPAAAASVAATSRYGGGTRCRSFDAAIAG